eukprot:scaffold25426_cov88-Cylindrotheca_fusiformis.AAC.1
MECRFDISGTGSINSVKKKSSFASAAAKHDSMKGFHLCRNQHVRPTSYQDENDDNNTTSSSSLTLLYQCHGKSYDQFTDRLYSLVHRLTANANTNNSSKNNNNKEYWGRRDFPVPAGKTVVWLGNSHLRQVAKTLVCQYHATVVEDIQLHEEQGDSFTVQFTNGAKWVIITNTILVHSEIWPELIQEYFNVSLNTDGVDAIVLGKFTTYAEAQNTNYAITMAEEEEQYASLLGKPVNFTSISPPTLSSVVQQLQQQQRQQSLSSLSSTKKKLPLPMKILFLPMFAISDVHRAQEEYEEYLEHEEFFSTTLSKQQQMKKKLNNKAISFTAIRYIESRQYIDALGLECGSDDKYTIGTCHEPPPNSNPQQQQQQDNNNNNHHNNPRNPADMHR